MVFRDNSEGVKPENATVTITEAWTKDPPAQHVTMSGISEKDTIEIIQIGKDSYVNFGGQWMKSSSDDAVKAMGAADLASWMKDSDQQLKLVGAETVNGVRTRHYTYDVTMPIRTEQGVSLKAKGDVWIADEPPIAGIAVKEKAEVEYVGRTPKPAAKGAPTTMNLIGWTRASWERELTDINKPFVIKAPENVTDFAGLLTPQATGAPRATSTPRAPGTPATASRTATPVATARATVAATAPAGAFAWRKVDSDASDHLNRIVLIGANSGFAFGPNGDTLRLSGRKWVSFDLSEAEGIPITDAQVLNDRIVWAVGNRGLILRFDGSKWTRYQSPTEEDLSAIAMTSDSEGWAAGSGGTLLRFSGGSWTSVSPSPLGSDWTTTEILMVSADDGWLFGDGGQMMRLKAGKWVDASSERDGDDTISFAARVPGSKYIWAFGYDRIWRHDGAKWSPLEYPLPGVTLAGAAFASARDGWAVGSSGTILRWNGTAWAKWTSPVKSDLEAVAIASNGDAWIVGDGPTILQLSR